jgi:hypothetical protein
MSRKEMEKERFFCEYNSNPNLTSREKRRLLNNNGGERMDVYNMKK